MKRRAVVMALAFVGACFDSFLVDPEPNVETRFGVNLYFSEGARASATVLGFLNQGTDASGNPQAMTDSLMHVEGSPVTGDRLRNLIRYTWEDSTLRDTLAVTGPTFAIQESATTTLLIPLPSRDDPGFRDHVVGQDIQLNFRGFGSTIYGFGTGSQVWRLEVQDARTHQTRLRLEGSGTPESPLIIPWRLIGPMPGDSLEATVLAHSGHTSTITAYPTFVSIDAHLTWRMRIVAP